MTAPTAELGFRAFQSTDFNWTVRLQDIWKTAIDDVPEMHKNARRILLVPFPVREFRA